MAPCANSISPGGAAIGGSGRWRRDLAELRASKDPADRQVVIVLWSVTALIAVLIVNFVVGLLRNLGVV